MRPKSASSSFDSPDLVSAPTTSIREPMTQKASILDLPNELLSHVLTSGASTDWLYCLDYELFRAFRDAHPDLGRFALGELMRLHPQMLDHGATTNSGSKPPTSTQESDQLTWKLHLQEAIENPTTSSTWNLMRCDPFHPADFFNAAVADCPTKLYVKKIPLFADDVYFTFSLNNYLPHFPSTTTIQINRSPQPNLWSRLSGISLDCHITARVVIYILSRTHRTLEVAAFNLRTPGICHTPVHQSFTAKRTSADEPISMDALQSLKIQTFDSLKELFDKISLPSLHTVELVSYPTSGCFRSSYRINDPPEPILHSGLNNPWSNIKHLVIRSYDSINVNLDNIVSRCTQVEDIELVSNSQRFESALVHVHHE